jgi:integrase
MRGSVIKRGSSYSVVLDLGRDAATGERRRTWHSGYRTKRDAERARIKLLAEIDQGGYVEPATITLESFLQDRWLPAIAVRLRSNTLAMYRQNVKAHIVPRLGKIPLQRLTPPDLNAFFAELLAVGRRNGKGGLSERTVRIQHVILRRALSDAVRWGLLARNPAEYADPPRGRSAEALVWSPDQVRKFLEYHAEDRLLGLWRLAAATGMRRSELAGLRWDDLDLVDATVSVRQVVVEAAGTLLVTEPKTAASRRTIALDTGTVAALKRHRSIQTTERLAAGPVWRDTGMVFTMEDGGALRPNYITRVFSKRVTEAGLPPVTFHALRHSYLTMLVRAGEPLRVVSQRAGHSSPNVTLAVYSHALPGDDQAAASRGGRLLDS